MLLNELLWREILLIAIREKHLIIDVKFDPEKNSPKGVLTLVILIEKRLKHFFLRVRVTSFCKVREDLFLSAI